MFKLFKVLLLGLSVYAIATASPAQHQDMLKGVLAFKDAFFQACLREGGLCTLAIEKIQSGLFSRTSSQETKNLGSFERDFTSMQNSENAASTSSP